MTASSPPRPRSPVARRALELDALAAILPIDRRDRLAELLTDDDVATLKHLAKEGMGENSLRALASDLAYLEAWALASTGSALPWPAPEALALKFVAHHLWDPARRETEPPTACRPRWRHVDARAICCGSRGRMRRRPCGGGSPAGRRCITGKARRARSNRRRCVRRSGFRCARWRGRDAQKPARGDARHSRGAARDLRLRPARRYARRGAAAGRLRLGRAPAQRGRRACASSSLSTEEPVPKTRPTRFAARCPVFRSGLAAPRRPRPTPTPACFWSGVRSRRLREWLLRADIAKGAIFRAIDRWGGLDDRALTPQAVNAILKRRVARGRARPEAYSAHGLRAGYLTEAARAGVSLPEAMQQSQHRSVQQAASYYNDAERRLGRAARLVV